MANENAVNKAQADLGTPSTPTFRKKEKTTFLLASSGDVSFFLADEAEPKVGSEGFEDPEMKLYLTIGGVVGSFKNDEGELVNYIKKIPLDGTVEKIDKMIEFWTNVKRFVVETKIEIPVQDPEKNDLAAAISKYKKSKG